MIEISRLTGTNQPEPNRWIYFAPPQFNELPPTHRDQFYFLDKQSTKTAYEMANSIDLLCGDDGWGNTPFSDYCYKTVERFDLVGAEEGIKKWLYRLGPAFKTEVLLLPVFKTENCPVILTTWKMVVKYSDIFFSSDNLVVVPPALRWCLYYHHDGVLHLALDRKY